MSLTFTDLTALAFGSLDSSAHFCIELALPNHNQIFVRMVVRVPRLALPVSVSSGVNRVSNGCKLRPLSEAPKM